MVAFGNKKNTLQIENGNIGFNEAKIKTQHKNNLLRHLEIPMVSNNTHRNTGAKTIKVLEVLRGG